MPETLPLSISIVCKDNAATIERTLESVRAQAGEIVALDSGSTDGTIAILERFGARVISTTWLGHVKTKQAALEACSLDWALCIDSDESLDPALAQLIRSAIARADGGPAGYEVNRVIWYRDRPLRHVWQPEWRLRLVRRGAAGWKGFDPHDSLELNTGRAGRLAGTMRHDSFPTFSEHMRKQWTHSTTMARSLHAAGVRGSRLRLLTSPAGAFFKQLLIKRGFLDGYPGWLAAASTACGALIKHATLIELDQGRADKA